MRKIEITFDGVTASIDSQPILFSYLVAIASLLLERQETIDYWIGQGRSIESIPYEAYAKEAVKAGFDEIANYSAYELECELIQKECPYTNMIELNAAMLTYCSLTLETYLFK